MKNVAIIGTGNIGCDLLVKLSRSKHLKCTSFIGRTPNSQGLAFARDFNVHINSNGIEGLLDCQNEFDIVFDATSASENVYISKEMKRIGKSIINLTPNLIGTKCVPVINASLVANEKNINLISCGGQASIPIINAISQSCTKPLRYVEIVSSISAESAGIATRQNLSEYMVNTESAILEFSRCEKAKVILIINPAKPAIKMQTTIFAIPSESPDIKLIDQTIKLITEKIQNYIIGYNLVMAPFFDGSKITVMVEVTGSGDYLPKYSGNLDIITCASVQVAEHMARLPI